MKPGSGSGDAHGETMHIGSLADGYGSLRVLVGEASSSVEDWMCFFFWGARMLHYWPSLPEEPMRMVSWQILVGTKAFIDKNPIQNKKPRNLAEIHPWSPVLVAKNLGLSKLPATLLYATACNLTISRTKVDLHHDGIL